jgi:hypothetical protein
MIGEIRRFIYSMNYFEYFYFEQAINCLKNLQSAALISFVDGIRVNSYSVNFENMLRTAKLEVSSN